jgi:hypothetical protein
VSVGPDRIASSPDHEFSRDSSPSADLQPVFIRMPLEVWPGAGWRVWFRPNQVVHWGEGGFGRVAIFVPGRRKAISPAELPAEIEFIAKPSNNKNLGEEITLTTLDRITYEPDQWL